MKTNSKIGKRLFFFGVLCWGRMKRLKRWMFVVVALFLCCDSEVGITKPHTDMFCFALLCAHIKTKLLVKSAFVSNFNDEINRWTSVYSDHAVVKKKKPKQKQNIVLYIRCIELMHLKFVVILVVLSTMVELKTYICNNGSFSIGYSTFIISNLHKHFTKRENSTFSCAMLLILWPFWCCCSQSCLHYVYSTVALSLSMLMMMMIGAPAHRDYLSFKLCTLATCRRPHNMQIYISTQTTTMPSAQNIA